MAGFISSLLRVRTLMPATLNAGIWMQVGVGKVMVAVMAGPLSGSVDGIGAPARGRSAREAWCVPTADSMMSVACAHPR